MTGVDWAGRTPETLRIEEVREREDFQLRANGISQPHANKLLRVLKGGNELPPIHVALIGKAMYVVDGFHRLHVLRSAKRHHVQALVVRMSLKEAQAEARLANTKHGLNPSRADKQRAWDDLVAAGDHLDAKGIAKPSRVIAEEMGYIYSRETIRQKLKALGVELNEGSAFEPREAPDEATLAEERAEEADTLIGHLAALLPTLVLEDRERLIRTARAMLDAMERGEGPAELLETMRNPLGI